MRALQSCQLEAACSSCTNRQDGELFCIGGDRKLWDPVKFILLSLLTDWQTFLLVMHTNPTFYFVNHATGRKNKKQLEYSRWL